MLGGPGGSELPPGGGAEGAGSPDLSLKHHGQMRSNRYQLDVKSNLSPVSRMFFSVRFTNSTTRSPPIAVSAMRITSPSTGTAWTTSIHTATKSTLAKLIGTRYFQHMFII